MGWDNSSFLFLDRSLWGNGGELVLLKWLVLRFSLCSDRLYAHMLCPTKPSCIKTHVTKIATTFVTVQRVFRPRMQAGASRRRCNAKKRLLRRSRCNAKN